MFECLNSVPVTSGERASVTYAKARAAIDAECAQRQAGNAASAKTMRTAKRNKLIEWMGGTINNDGKKITVIFGDGSTAKY